MRLVLNRVVATMAAMTQSRNAILMLTACAALTACGNIGTQGVQESPDNEAARSAPDYSPQPYANLAQLMRALNYANAEIVFAAQAEDFEAARNEAVEPLGPNRELYGGWEGVENAALMLSEAANLMLIPGRYCENGLPVPLGDDGFRTYTEGLIEAGQAAYRAATMRDTSAITEVSGVLSEACLRCHEVYRDKPAGEMRCISKNP